MNERELRMDECKHCTARGDFDKCIKNQCSVRENWGFRAAVARANANADELRAALARSPYDVAACSECGRPVVCLPDGQPVCNECAKGELDQ